jgi:hypothetical protein
MSVSRVESHKEWGINKVVDTILERNINLQLKGVHVAKPYLQGKPGGGKTASILAMCMKNKWALLHLHLPLTPLEDLSGLPQFKDVEVVKDGKKEMVEGTRWTLPEIMTELFRLSSDGKPTILFLDDMHLASPGHLALGFELFSERKLRTYKIPDNVAFVLAGNASSKAGTKTQNSAILNRLAIYPVNTDFNHWKTSFAIHNNINDKVIAFLSKDTYQSYFHEEETVNSPWSSPRSWSYLSEMINDMEGPQGKEINKDSLLYTCAAHIGSKAAAEFCAFYHIYSKTRMDEVFRVVNPLAVTIPESEMDKYIYAIAASNEFVNITKRSKDKEVIAHATGKICEIFNNLGKTSEEIVVSAFKNIVELERAIKVENSSSQTSYTSIINKMKVLNTPIAERIRLSIRQIIQ